MPLIHMAFLTDDDCLVPRGVKLADRKEPIRAPSQNGTGFASFNNPTSENPATRAGSGCATCYSAELAAASEAETGEG